MMNLCDEDSEERSHEITDSPDEHVGDESDDQGDDNEEDLNEDDEEDLIQRLQEEGEELLTVGGDHGTPMVGAWNDCVYVLGREYYLHTPYDDQVEGPFDSLNELLAASSLGISSATTDIHTYKLSPDEVAERISIEFAEPGQSVTINDEEWWSASSHVTSAGQKSFKPLPTRPPGSLQRRRTYEPVPNKSGTGHSAKLQV